MLKLCYQQTTGSYHRHCQDHYQIHAEADRVIAAVADGHGGRPYVRSGLGARFACAAAVKLLRAGIAAQEFPKAMKQTFDHMVKKHLEHRPLVDWEQERLDGRPAWQAYGTTLMAAVMTADKAVLFQVGDGEIHALDANGSFLQALPADENCHGNITTSLVQDMPWVLRNFRYRELPGCSAVMLFTDGFTGAWKMAEGLLNPEALESHVAETLRRGRHGDDQTFVMVYLPEKVRSDAFQNGLQEHIGLIRTELEKRKQREVIRKELDELRVYLHLAMRRAEKLKEENSADYETYLQKLKPKYERYLQLQQQLESLGKEWLICL